MRRSSPAQSVASIRTLASRLSPPQYLREMGPFDEVMAVRSWPDSGSLKYLYGEELGRRVAIPRILVLERVVEEIAGGYPTASSERTRFRKVGGEDIVRQR